MKKILEYMVFTFVIADIVYLIGMVYVLMHDYIWKKRGKKRKILSGVSIKVLLPALREVSLVKETIENFDSILNEYKNSIAYIITTQKEDEEIKEGELSTHKCVLNNIKGHEQFLSLHYCGEKQGNKPRYVRDTILTLEDQRQALLLLTAYFSLRDSLKMAVLFYLETYERS